jgi:outer membrane protein TolC
MWWLSSAQLRQRNADLRRENLRLREEHTRVVADHADTLLILDSHRSRLRAALSDLAALKQARQQLQAEVDHLSATCVDTTNYDQVLLVQMKSAA